MRWKPHVRFGERAGETDQLRSRHRAPVRLHLAGHKLDLCRQRVQQDTLGHPRTPGAHRGPALRHPSGAAPRA